MPIFHLVYTTRRAQAIAWVVKAWFDRAAHPERVRMIIAVDSDYDEGRQAALKLSLGRADIITVTNNGPSNCVNGWNAGAAAVVGEPGHILIAVADDFMPPPRWDDELENVALPGWWMNDQVVWVSDGYSPDLFTLAILTWKRYQRFGYLFYPQYESLFSDTEFTAVARSEHVVIDGRRLLFEHLHPDCNKRKRDAVDAIHASSDRWKQGEMLFKFRQSTGFPLDDGPRAAVLEITYQNLVFAAYVQAIRDDLCLYEVMARIAEEGDRLKGMVKAVYVCEPDEYWSGKPRTQQDRQEVDDACLLFSQRYPSVILKRIQQPVAEHRPGAGNRLDVETRVRNAAVNAIRQDGYEHILILDGDELWKPGLLARLAQYVREHRPQSVFTGMVPTVGLPGYPIAGALDKAGIYIGPGGWFTDCRGVSGYRHELVSNDVIHFTATRRTMEEIIKKHRESGHFDDPSYDFEGWIANTLPNLHVGMKDVHMWHAGRNVWPLLREWAPDEIAAIPQSIHRYLAIGDVPK